MLQPLEADIADPGGGLGFDRLDYLVVSGDLTNCASAAEFKVAYEFISGIVKRFALSAQRCIIVPGNHDLNWDEDVYQFQMKRRVDVSKLRKGHFLEQGEGYLIRDDAKYRQRFKNFDAHFYHLLMQTPYPLEYDRQCMPFLFPDTRVQFLSMNSAWEIDEHFRRRASIHAAALSRGLTEADTQIERARQDGSIPSNASIFRIAVWHHPATGNEKIEDDAFLDRLRQKSVRMCLHGHVHEERADVIAYTHQRRLYAVGAGSFGAPINARPESTPRLYNVLEVSRDHGRIRVYTRSLRRESGAWTGWYVWAGAAPGEARSYYDVILSNSE